MTGITQFETSEGGYITVAEYPAYVVSYTKHTGDMRRCLREGKNGRTIQHGELNYCEWLMPPKQKTRNFHVYIFRPSSAIRRSYNHAPAFGFIVARSIEAAGNHLKRKWTKRVKRYAGMAKDALTLAMMKTSTKADAGRVITGSHARKVLRKAGVLKVNVYYGNDFASVNVQDNLVYATQALNGGASAVDFCLKKAANSVNGNINAYIKSHANSFFDDAAKFDIQDAPFPEVIEK